MAIDERRDKARNSLEAWIAGELVRRVGFEEGEARSAIHQYVGAYLSRNSELEDYPRRLIFVSAEIVACLRAPVPGGRDWWQSTAGRVTLSFLNGARGGYVYPNVAEAVAEPAPDEIDPNWPASKIWGAQIIPPGLGPGDEFTLGNGEGMRARLRVEERDGKLGSVVVNWTDPLRPLFDEAREEAARIIESVQEGDG